MLTRKTDPPRQGREAAREAAPGGDGRQACQDQGGPRAQAGEGGGEEERPDGGSRGGQINHATRARTRLVTMMRATTVSITSKVYQKGHRGTGSTRTGLVRVILWLCREQMQKQKEPERQHKRMGGRPSIRSHRDCLHGLLLYLPPRASGRGKPGVVKGLWYQGSIVLERDCLCRCGFPSDCECCVGAMTPCVPSSILAFC